MSNIKSINSLDEFKSEVLKSQKPVLVDFWAPWCGPCKMIAPVLDSISEEQDDVLIVKVNVDENQDIASQFKLRGIPTMIIFNQGEQVGVKVGATTKDGIKSWINTVI